MLRGLLKTDTFIRENYSVSSLGNLPQMGHRQPNSLTASQNQFGPTFYSGLLFRRPTHLFAKAGVRFLPSLWRNRGQNQQPSQRVPAWPVRRGKCPTPSAKNGHHPSLKRRFGQLKNVIVKAQLRTVAGFVQEIFVGHLGIQLLKGLQLCFVWSDFCICKQPKCANCPRLWPDFPLPPSVLRTWTRHVQRKLHCANCGGRGSCRYHSSGRKRWYHGNGRVRLGRRET